MSSMPILQTFNTSLLTPPSSLQLGKLETSLQKMHDAYGRWPILCRNSVGNIGGEPCQSKLDWEGMSSASTNTPCKAHSSACGRCPALWTATALHKSHMRHVLTLTGPITRVFPLLSSRERPAGPSSHSGPVGTPRTENLVEARKVRFENSREASKCIKGHRSVSARYIKRPRTLFTALVIGAPLHHPVQAEQESHSD